MPATAGPAASITLLVALAACSPDVQIESLPSPGAAGAITPHLAVDADSRVHLSWQEPVSEGRWRLRYSVLEADSWTPAISVSEGGDWFVNWADFPSVVPIAADRIAAHWLLKRPGGRYAYDIVIAQSLDGGETWSPAVSPHHDGTATEHGFVTLFPWQDELGAVWLDGRQLAAADTGSHHGHGGGMSLRYARLTTTGDIAAAGEIDALTCDCCQTDVALAGGHPVVVYRDRSPGEIRDIYVSRWEGNRWSVPIPVAADGWHMPACPVNGPAIAAAGATLAVAWYTAADRRPSVKVAFSTAQSPAFGAPITIDQAAPAGRVDVALDERGNAWVSWLTGADSGGIARLSVARVRRDGTLAGPIDVARLPSSRSSGLPQMVLAESRLVIAWTEPGTAGGIRSAALPIGAFRQP